ncbi:YdeI/OmpD-associated family protein [Pyxidicoccus sp. 3LG]
MAVKKSGLDELERFQAGSRKQWRTWLERHHLTSPGVWLVTFKKETGKPRIDYEEAVEELLCFGWVDSKGMKLDDERSMLLCRPRSPKSAWSKPNKERVERLIAAGLMAPRGLEMVELAKQRGTWDALNDVEALVEPEDLKARLDRSANARTHWDAFPRSVKRAILDWIRNAKRPETRQKRIDETVTQAAKNVRANQWRQ